MQNAEAIVAIIAIVGGVSIALSILKLIARAITARHTAQTIPDAEILRRLDRIEQAVETTAVEVERISEANRFVAKLLSEKSEARLT